MSNYKLSEDRTTNYSLNFKSLLTELENMLVKHATQDCKHQSSVLASPERRDQLDQKSKHIGTAYNFNIFLNKVNVSVPTTGTGLY